MDYHEHKAMTEAPECYQGLAGVVRLLQGLSPREHLFANVSKVHDGLESGLGF